MSPTICGRDVSAAASNYVFGTQNKCDINSIASPDNVDFDNVRGILLISEDTSNHQNDATWAVRNTIDMTYLKKIEIKLMFYLQNNPLTGELTRIMVSPYGSEIISTGVFRSGTCTMIYSVIQHPYGETDAARLSDPENTGNENWLVAIVTDPNLPLPATVTHVMEETKGVGL